MSIQSEITRINANIAAAYAALSAKGAAMPTEKNSENLAAAIQSVSTESEKIQMELLWENPDTTASFAAQTVSLTLGENDLVMINGVTSAGNEYITMPHFLRVGESGMLLSDVGNGVRRRLATVTATGVEFGAGGTQTSTSNVTSSNSVMIPYRIYVIRDFIA